MKSILVADHDQDYMSHISIIMRRMGFRVFPCDDPEEVLKTIEIKTPDLILINPAISGDGFIAEIQGLRMNSEGTPIPIVILSSEPDDMAGRKCTDLRCTGYLRKPINVRTLHNTLQDFLYRTDHKYQRRNLRAKVSLDVTVENNGVKQVLATESVSEGGVFVCTEAPMPVNTTVKVTIPLEYGSSISFGGRVIYINMLPIEGKSVPHGMAIEFTDPDPGKRMILSDYVSGLLTVPYFMT